MEPETKTVEELLTGVAVESANDTCPRRIYRGTINLL